MTENIHCSPSSGVCVHEANGHHVGIACFYRDWEIIWGFEREGGGHTQLRCPLKSLLNSHSLINTLSCCLSSAHLRSPLRRSSPASLSTSFAVGSDGEAPAWIAITRHSADPSLTSLRGLPCYCLGCNERSTDRRGNAQSLGSLEKS